MCMTHIITQGVELYNTNLLLLLLLLQLPQHEGLPVSGHVEVEVGVGSRLCQGRRRAGLPSG